MEVNYFKCNTIQTVLPIDLKFVKYNEGYFVVHRSDFHEYRSNGISTGKKGVILYINVSGADLFKLRLHPNGESV